MRNRKLVIFLVFCCCLCVFTGCNKSDESTKESSDISQSSSVSVASDNAESKAESMKYSETALYDFFGTYNYENFIISTSDGKKYYNYNNECVVTTEEDVNSIRVIRDNIVYQIWGDQYWDASAYDYYDNPYEIRSVIHIDEACTYYKLNNWYYTDYKNSDCEFCKYKLNDNTITVVKLKCNDAKPFESEVISEVTYTITELKDKADMPNIDLGVLEEVVVDYNYTDSNVSEESAEVLVPEEILYEESVDENTEDENLED